MFITIALILSVVIQFLAAVIAISLIRRTKTNIAWVLISMGFLVMAVRMFFELLIVIDPENKAGNSLFNIWLGILVSLLMLLSLIFIKRIFNINKKFDDLRQEKETEVLSAIVKTEENERMRFAKELHDGLGPLLSSIKMSVSTIKKQMGNDSDLRIIENADKLIDESIITIKEISNNISPHILNNFGLYKALQSFVAKIQSSHNINIVFNSNVDKKRYGYNTEVVFYRVICELITNSLKHAFAKRISIDLFEDKDELLLEYMDDGIGFSPEKVEMTSQGMGLVNLKSRINSLNGTSQIISRKGNGVCFTIKVKVN